MSQSAVGGVYSKVIDAVCEQSQIDFEEGGIDQGTLELLKSGWRKKLTDLKVAQLPWDPPPPSASAQHTSSASASTAKHQPQTVPSNGNSAPAPSSATNTQRANDGTRIKPEPGSYQSPASQPNGFPMPPMQQFPPGSNVTAQQRAAMNLQQRYGNQAAQQITQLQQSGQPRPQGAPTAPSAPYSKIEDQKSLMSNLPPFSPAVSQSPKLPVNSSQTDGAGDSLAEWKAEVARRRELAAHNPGEGDRLLREHFRGLQQRMEGGGLMVPLDERYMPSQGKRRKIQKALLEENSPTAAGPSHFTTDEHNTSLSAAQADAAGDNDADEVDEDAINSDLDDSDQQEDDDNNEENTDQVMLCTYDKVQRVKNKWKCTLKDGIVKVGSTDYVFHKGQGEFEW